MDDGHAYLKKKHRYIGVALQGIGLQHQNIDMYNVVYKRSSGIGSKCRCLERMVRDATENVKIECLVRSLGVSLVLCVPMI